ncbi:MAG TPA: DUF1257 domain-containing protein [Candidatus Limnocylindrales bacterium]|jgi:hypothetical protein|nr:DUF1257 domain-containing protein [Candidatus Limnocylindrales bacterium]
MSRFVSIKTELRDGDILKESLRELKCTVIPQTEMTLYAKTQPISFLSVTPFGRVGFRINDQGQYEMVGDEEVLKKQGNFLDRLTQRYAYNKVVKEAKKAGFSFIKEEVMEDNSIRVVIRKW